jgi:hypothetical protein
LVASHATQRVSLRRVHDPSDLQVIRQVVLVFYAPDDRELALEHFFHLHSNRLGGSVPWAQRA